MITEERLLVKGGIPHRDVGRATRVGQLKKRDLAYKSILIRRQDDPEVAVLAPTVRNIDLRLVFVRRQ